MLTARGITIILWQSLSFELKLLLANTGASCENLTFPQPAGPITSCAYRPMLAVGDLPALHPSRSLKRALALGSCSCCGLIGSDLSGAFWTPCPRYRCYFCCTLLQT